MLCSLSTSNQTIKLVFLSFTESTVDTTTRTPYPHFRRRYGYTSTTARTRQPITTTTTSTELPRTRNSDQEIESSIVETKFLNSRLNQIEAASEPFDEGIAEAITKISRAPLPFSAPATTVRGVKITTPGSAKYDTEFEYQITKRSDLLATSSKFHY